MATYIKTLKDNTRENNILPRTRLKAVSDDDGNYLSDQLAASDLNQLAGKKALTTAAQTLTDTEKSQARQNINSAAPDGYYGESGGVFQYATNFLGKGTPTIVNNLTYRPTASQMSGNAWTGGDISGNVATIEKIKGETLVWNQLVHNGNFVDGSVWEKSTYVVMARNDGIATISTSTASNRQFYIYQPIDYVAGHRYFVSCFAASKIALTNVSDRLRLQMGGKKVFSLQDSKEDLEFKRRSAIVTAPSDNTTTSLAITIGAYAASAGQELFSVSNVFAVDLSKMFGVGNEPETAEEFIAMFPEMFYPYNAGELLNFNGTGLKTDGFNQLKSNGQIDVIAKMTYKIEGTYTSLKDSAGNDVTVTDGEFTPSQNDTYTMVGGSCVHFKWSGVRDGETENPWSNILDLSAVQTYFPNGLNGLSDYTGENFLRDELTKDKAIQKVGLVDLGTLTWQYMTSYGKNPFFMADVPRSIKANSSYLKCPLYYNDVFVTSLASFGNTANNLSMFLNANIASASSGRIMIRNDAYTSASDFKAAMAGVPLLFRLANYVETPISPELNLVYPVDDFGTERELPINGSVPTTTPMYMDTLYQIDYESAVRNMDVNTISKASMDSFISAFNGSGLGTITQTWNPATKQYDYTVMPPAPEVTEEV